MGVVDYGKRMQAGIETERKLRERKMEIKRAKEMREREKKEKSERYQHMKKEANIKDTERALAIKDAILCWEYLEKAGYSKKGNIYKEKIRKIKKLYAALNASRVGVRRQLTQDLKQLLRPTTKVMEEAKSVQINNDRIVNPQLYNKERTLNNEQHKQ